MEKRPFFKYKKGIPVSYDKQGYVYFTSKRYREFSQEDQKTIRDLCKMSAGYHWQAILEFVTTDANATYIENKHHISHATLYRYVQRYYVQFPNKL